MSPKSRVIPKKKAGKSRNPADARERIQKKFDDKPFDPKQIGQAVATRMMTPSKTSENAAMSSKPLTFGNLAQLKSTEHSPTSHGSSDYSTRFSFGSPETPDRNVFGQVATAFGASANGQCDASKSPNPTSPTMAVPKFAKDPFQKVEDPASSSIPTQKDIERKSPFLESGAGLSTLFQAANKAMPDLGSDDSTSPKVVSKQTLVLNSTVFSSNRVNFTSIKNENKIRNPFASLLQPSTKTPIALANPFACVNYKTKADSVAESYHDIIASEEQGPFPGNNDGSLKPLVNTSPMSQGSIFQKSEEPVDIQSDSKPRSNLFSNVKASSATFSFALPPASPPKVSKGPTVKRRKQFTVGTSIKKRRWRVTRSDPARWSKKLKTAAPKPPSDTSEENTGFGLFLQQLEEWVDDETCSEPEAEPCKSGPLGDNENTGFGLFVRKRTDWVDNEACSELQSDEPCESRPAEDNDNTGLGLFLRRPQDWAASNEEDAKDSEVDDEDFSAEEVEDVDNAELAEFDGNGEEQFDGEEDDEVGVDGEEEFDGEKHDEGGVKGDDEFDGETDNEVGVEQNDECEGEEDEECNGEIDELAIKEHEKSSFAEHERLGVEEDKVFGVKEDDKDENAEGVEDATVSKSISSDELIEKDATMTMVGDVETPVEESPVVDEKPAEAEASLEQKSQKDVKSAESEKPVEDVPQKEAEPKQEEAVPAKEKTDGEEPAFVDATLTSAPLGIRTTTEDFEETATEASCSLPLSDSNGSESELFAADPALQRPMTQDDLPIQECEPFDNQDPCTDRLEVYWSSMPNTLEGHLPYIPIGRSLLDEPGISDFIVDTSPIPRISFGPLLLEDKELQKLMGTDASEISGSEWKHTELGLGKLGCQMPVSSVLEESEELPATEPAELPAAEPAELSVTESEKLPATDSELFAELNGGSPNLPVPTESGDDDEAFFAGFDSETQEWIQNQPSEPLQGLDPLEGYDPFEDTDSHKLLAEDTPLFEDFDPLKEPGFVEGSTPVQEREEKTEVLLPSGEEETMFKPSSQSEHDSLEAVDPLEAVNPVEAVIPVEAVEPVEAVNPVEAVDLIEAADPIGAIDPLEDGNEPEASVNSPDTQSVPCIQSPTVSSEPVQEILDAKTVENEFSEPEQNAILRTEERKPPMTPETPKTFASVPQTDPEGIRALLSRVRQRQKVLKDLSSASSPRVRSPCVSSPPVSSPTVDKLIPERSSNVLDFHYTPSPLKVDDHDESGLGPSDIFEG